MQGLWWYEGQNGLFAEAVVNDDESKLIGAKNRFIAALPTACLTKYHHSEHYSHSRSGR
jgi:hypothetical protein